MAGYALYLNKCTACDAAKSILIDEGGPVCVDQNVSPWNSGYRVVSTNPFRLIEACMVADCNTCPDLKSTCKTCKTGFVLYQNNCIQCDAVPSSSHAIHINDSGLPECVTTDSGTYSSGFGLDTTISTFRLIAKCTASDCNLCAANKDICTDCATGFVLYLKKCTQCDAAPSSKHAIFVNDSGSPECVATDSGTYSSGYRQDTTIGTFRLIEACTVTDCHTCPDLKSTCKTCKKDHVFHLNKCTLCPQSDPSKAIVVLTYSSPKCVDVSSAPYSSGYRVDTSVTDFKLIEACKIPNCSTCPASVSSCTTCVSTYVLSTDSLTCITPTPQPSAQSPQVSKPPFTARHDSLRNSLTLFHNQGPSVQITKATPARTLGANLLAGY